MIKIDTAIALEGKPRPHFLVGQAEYSFKDGEHKLVAQVIFPSSRDSIGDRNKPPIPHANIGDAYFAIWNAVHLICDEAKVYGTLTSQGNFEARRPLPPDKLLRLEVILKETDLNSRHVHADYMGRYYLGNDALLIISGKGVGRKREI